MKFCLEQWHCVMQLVAPQQPPSGPSAHLQASCPGGKALAHCEAKSAEPAAGSAGAVLESEPVCRQKSQQHLGKLLFLPVAENPK